MDIKIIIILVILSILYFISRNYKHSNYQNIKVDGKQKFDGDIFEHEAGLLVALMAKVAKADGKVCELEAQMLKHTFTDISNHFENSEEIREQLKAIYNREKESFENTIEICQKYLKLSKFHYQKRLKIMEYLLNMAFIDGEFSEAEVMITEDIAKALEIKQADFEKLVQTFRTFYASKINEKINSLAKAYEILGSKPEDNFDVIKQNYRKLVKLHHPDIIKGQGGDDNIIEAATRKLQEINEAYEIVKKDKNV